MFRNSIIDYRTRRLIQSSNIKSFDGKIPATAHCSSILGTHAYGCMELHLPFTTRLTISVNRNERAKNVIQKLIALYNIINLNLRFAEYFFYTSKMWKKLSKRERQGGRGGVTEGTSKELHTSKTFKHWFRFHERKNWWQLWSEIYK